MDGLHTVTSKHCLYLCRASPLLLTRGTASTARALNLRAESNLYSKNQDL